MAKTKLTIKELRDFLKTLNEDELTEEIVKLVKMYPGAREHYLTKIKPEHEEEIKEKYKKIIKNEFFPKRGYGSLNFSVIRKTLSDFKKVSDNKESLIDLIFAAVEYGIDFALKFGDIYEDFFIKIENMYETALKEIIKTKDPSHFFDRCEELINKANKTGWGFGDSLECLNDEYINNNN